MSTHNATLIRQWFEEVWNKGRVEAIDAMLAADYVTHGLGMDGGDLRGHGDPLFVWLSRERFRQIGLNQAWITCLVSLDGGGGPVLSAPKSFSVGRSGALWQPGGWPIRTGLTAGRIPAESATRGRGKGASI